MAKRIMKKAKDESIFQYVVMASGTPPRDIPSIQNEIAEALGFELSDKIPQHRTDTLYAKLKDKKKGILIILDDVWEILEPHEIGIPCLGSKATCKLIVISRNVQNFNIPGVHVKEISLKILNHEESVSLFKHITGTPVAEDIASERKGLPHALEHKAGIAVDSLDKNQLAEAIASECEGLPLALVHIGCELNRSHTSCWEKILTELRNSKPINAPRVVEKVYKTLMSSVEQLNGREKYLFLLCCLFPKGYKISVEELVRYGMGLRIFGVEGLMETRMEVEVILRNLISHSLLIDCTDNWDTLCVKMHYVIRDMGIWIASKEKIEFEKKNKSDSGIASEERHLFMVSHGEEKWPMRSEESDCNYTCISIRFSKEDVDIPESMNCLSLKFLHFGLMRNLQGIYFNIPEKFFSGMESLRVLEASNLSSLPPSVFLLKNLLTLYLYDCEMFGVTSKIGELANLEILCLESCKVDVLPEEIGKLKKLRQLYISNCRGLRVASGVISRLVQLEELVILDSFSNWDAQANGKTNAGLTELDCLEHLTSLKIEISNPGVIPRERSPRWVQKVKYSKVKDYSIAVSESAQTDPRFHKAITLGYEVVNPLGEWFCDMACDVEYLNLAGLNCLQVEKQLANCSRNPNCLKCLSLSKLKNVQYLATGEGNGAIFPMLKSLCIKDSPNFLKISNVPPPAESFKALEEIELRSLPSLVCLWKFPGGKQEKNNRSFLGPACLGNFPHEKLYLSNLKRVLLADCKTLAYLFSSSIAQNLSLLEELKVSNCPMMEEIFKKEDEEMEINKIDFPKLDSLYLESMKGLRCLCKGVDGIEISALRRLELINLPSFSGIGGIYQHCLFEQQFAGNFSGLQILKVESIQKFKCLFSPSILSRLSNLKELEVGGCSELEEVIGKDGNVGETTVFPELKKLMLINLPKILTFCYTCVKWPLLEQLHIISCPLMDGLFQGLSNTPNSRADLPFFSTEFAGNFSGLQILKVESIQNLRCLFSPSILSEFSNLKELKVRDCSELEAVIGKDETVEETILFPKLQELRLFNLSKILTFCYTCVTWPLLEQLHITSCPLMDGLFQGLSNTPNSRFNLPFFNAKFAGDFSGLQILKVESIKKFKCLFSPSILSRFSNLKELEVGGCSELEEVIGKDKDVENTIEFPKLKVLALINLPKILTFCCTGVELPSLEQLRIISCPLMEGFLQRLSDTSNSRFSLPLFNEEVYCPKLNSLELRGLSIARIFSPRAFRGLTNLKKLHLSACKEVEEVIANEEVKEGLTNNNCEEIEEVIAKEEVKEGLTNNNCGEIEEVITKEEVTEGLANNNFEEVEEVIAKKEVEEGLTNNKEILSHQLEEFNLWNLPKIHKFCHMKQGLKLPSLKTADFKDCPNLGRFSLGPLYLPNFTRIHGLSNVGIAEKIFFNKKISFRESHSEENNCFTIYAREISLIIGRFNRPQEKWILIPNSSESFVDEIHHSGSFVDAVELSYFKKSMEITGNFEATELVVGVAYKIMLMMMFNDYESAQREDRIEIELTLSEGMTQQRTEILNKRSRDKWIEIFLGNITRESHQSGQLRFVLRKWAGKEVNERLCIKGVRIMEV